MPIWIMYWEGISLPKQRDFLEEITELQKILDIGLKQSRLHKKERLEKEKIRQANMQSDNIEMEKLRIKDE